MNEILIRGIVIAAVSVMLVFLRKTVNVPAVSSADGTMYLKPAAVFRILFWLLLVVFGIIAVLSIANPPREKAELIAFLCLTLGFGAAFVWTCLVLYRYQVYWDARGLYVKGVLYGLEFCPWEEITGGKYGAFSGKIILHSQTGGIRFQAHMQGTSVLLQEILQRTGIPREEFRIPQSFFTLQP